ncbi:MAG: hypothetical protein JWM14_2980 [Chitinophagaceae bacterium]|nr:hypothetical protein [Chitinophagaceae bacterium]
MKKKVLLTLFSFLGLATVSSAQISFGPKLGVGLSTFRDVKKPADQPGTNYSYLVVPQVGVLLNVQLGNHLAVRPELLYTQRATAGESSSIYFGNTYSAKIIMRVSYIELPINVVGNLKAGPGNIELFAGPSFGYVLGGNTKTELTSPSGTENREGNVIAGKSPENYNDPGNTDQNTYINPFNVSLNFGAGYKFNNGLLIQLGYNLGFSNLVPHSDNSATENKRSDTVVKSSAFTLGIAYLFGGKK